MEARQYVFDRHRYMRAVHVCFYRCGRSCEYEFQSLGDGAAQTIEEFAELWVSTALQFAQWRVIGDLRVEH